VEHWNFQHFYYSHVFFWNNLNRSSVFFAEVSSLCVTLHSAGLCRLRICGKFVQFSLPAFQMFHRVTSRLLLLLLILTPTVAVGRRFHTQHTTINTSACHPPRTPSNTTMTSIEAAAQALLTPNPADFDVNLLDQVVTAAYNPVDPNRAVANKALMALQESPDVWTKADAILERAQNPQSRFFGLQVLDDAIRIR
jgi:hypothetical protein